MRKKEAFIELVVGVAEISKCRGGGKTRPRPHGNGLKIRKHCSGHNLFDIADDDDRQSSLVRTNSVKLQSLDYNLVVCSE